MSEYKTNFRRKEIKYLMSKEQYENLKPYLETIAEVDEYGRTRINNIYFDTPEYRLIRTSLEKPVYKEKLRLRTYGATGDTTNSFIEIKKKYKGIVYKRRVNGDYRRAYDYLVNEKEPLDSSQISDEIEAFVEMYKDLKPAMRISYDRIAMAGKDDKELRLTFDSNITWDISALDLTAAEHGHQILKKGQVLMELKVADAIPMELADKLSELGIYPTSFSKYGRGYMEMIGKKAKRMSWDSKTEENFEKEVVAYA